MEIKGNVVMITAVQSGQGKSGIWKKQELLLETPGQYPKKVLVTLFGENIITKAEGIRKGMEITAHINIQSREYNGRWYTEVQAWKLEWTEEQARKIKGNPPVDPDERQYNDPSPNVSSTSDDLPF